MKVRQFESQEAFEKWLDKREAKTGEVGLPVGEFVYIHENERHNIDGEVKARSEKEAKAKLLEAMAQVGLVCGYDDEIYNDVSREGKDILKIEIEQLDEKLFYVNYIVSDFWNC